MWVRGIAEKQRFFLDSSLVNNIIVLAFVDKATKEEIMQAVIQPFCLIFQDNIGTHSVRR